MRRTSGRTRRRLALAGVGGIAAALAVASLAWACTPIQGNTWFSDGSFSKTGPTGTTITAFATSARINTQYRLVAGNNTLSGHTTHGCMDMSEPINPNVRTSNGSGFIPNTSGPINRPAGEWQICFRQFNPEGASSTNPVFFTII